MEILQYVGQWHNTRTDFGGARARGRGHQEFKLSVERTPAVLRADFEMCRQIHSVQHIACILMLS